MPKNNEDRLCIALMDYIRRQYPVERKYWFHVPNGGHRHRVTAALFKRLGVMPGVSDYHCMLPSGAWPSLWLEIKTDTGRPSDEQLEFLASARYAGHFAVVAYGWDEAKAIIDAWMRGTPEQIEWLSGCDKRRERNAARKRRTTNTEG